MGYGGQVMTRIPFYRPSFPPYEDVRDEIEEVYRSGMLAPGKYTDRLEEAVKERLGVKYVIAFSNCSDALIALLSIHRDQNIAVPAFTFSATWQAAEWNRCNVVLIDVDGSGRMSAEKLEDAFRKYRIDAVLPVHMFGNPSYVEDYQLIADQHGVPVYYDCAHGIGASYKGVPLGSFGMAEVISIGTTKCLPSGEGALVTTNSDGIARYMRLAAIHGHEKPRYDDSSLDVLIPSLNGRIQEFNSIIAFHGLKYLDDNIRRRNEIAKMYDDGLNGAILHMLVNVSEGNVCSYKDFSIIQAPNREFKQANMRILYEDFGIETKEYYYPSIPDLTMAKAQKDRMLGDDCPVARQLAKGAMSLPIYPSLSDEDVDYIIKSVNEVS